MNDFPILSKKKEFEFLIQPRSKTYISKLTKNIIDNGCNIPIEIWADFIVDGHLRYEICRKWEIPFHIKKLTFVDNNEAISYLCSRQLKREDLTRECQRYLLGRKFRADLEIASSRYKTEHPEQVLNAYEQVSHKHVKKYEVAANIGLTHHLCSVTIIKYDIYARALDNIHSVEPDIALKILCGELHVSQENIIELSRRPKEEIRRLKQLISDTGFDQIDYSQLCHELQWKRLPTGQSCTKTGRPRKEKGEAKIKQIPKHDPNAELTCLGYTIPSWIEIINRSIELTDFPSTSQTARSNLKIPLGNLTRKINKLLSLLEDN